MKITEKLSLRLLSILCVVCLLIGGTDVIAIAEGSVDPQNVQSEKVDGTADANGYFTYYKANEQQPRPQVLLPVIGTDFTGGTPTVQKVDGNNAVVLDSKNSWAEWQVTVSESGMYSVFPTYYPLAGTGKDILLSVTIDGQTPYTEASDLSLPRIWTDAKDANGKVISQNSAGNDLRPDQIEAPRWSTLGLRDVLGLYEEPYLFHMEQGTHTVRMTIIRESVAICKLQFGNQVDPPTYSDYLAKYSEKDYASGKQPIRLEAEAAIEKNSSMLYPSYDRSNPDTLPSDANHIRYNTIGGSNWSASGDSISWKVDVPESGLYQLAFRARQNYSEGLNSYRRLYINGQVPFKEAESLMFPYKQNWYIKTLGEGSPTYVYLKKGDIITLECNSSVMSQPTREIQQAVLDLNALYRDIIIITGTTPDTYQDFALDEKIPTLVESLKSTRDQLQSVSNTIIGILGKSCSEVMTINKAIDILSELANDPYYIPERLGSFKGNIESLSSLLLSLGGQPLELDCLYFIPSKASTPQANAGFLTDFNYEFQKFIGSFFNDYNAIGSTGLSKKDSIMVWANVGRDQAQIINQLIEQTFTTRTKIPVILNIVGGDATLIKSTLAGKGPDVSLFVAQTSSVNLAARGALVNLNKFDLSSLKAETYPSAWIPFAYNGGTYAMPETQSFDVMFYRTDIFKSLGLTPPSTWDDFYHVLEIVQSNNLQVALPEVDGTNQGNSLAISIFDKFLFQNGGDYYNSTLTKTLFDSEVANQAFEKTVDLYRTYGISRDLSFFNRFRSGEAPIGIAGYGMYAQLVASAPELRGLWSFSMIPGTIGKDKLVNRAESSAVSGCVMMSTAQKRGISKQAFTFMNWWTSADTQTRYGRDIEGILGIIGRINPANKKALSNLGWTDNELSVITGQMAWVKNPPQVIANYAVGRSLTSAIRGAINGVNTPRRSLSIYNKAINDEITRKRIEFKLK
jgi:ABC-type glycerol-3-phosphate transport system substrate-binding protein